MKRIVSVAGLLLVGQLSAAGTTLEKTDFCFPKYWQAGSSEKIPQKISVEITKTQISTRSSDTSEAGVFNIVRLDSWNETSQLWIARTVKTEEAPKGVEYVISLTRLPGGEMKLTFLDGVGNDAVTLSTRACAR